MHLFIDTNVFLNFFHLSGEDIEELKKIVELIKHGAITLYVTQQVCDEFARNREVKIADAIKQIPKSLKIKLPAFYRSHDKFEQLNQKLSSIDVDYAGLLAAVSEEIENYELAADKLIAQIFEQASVLEVDNETIYAAVRRLRRGNPPGKKDRSVVGDEINWECLLKGVPDETELHVVSVDGDFASVRDGSKIKKFLSDEWAAKKSSSVRLYKGLLPFFAEHFPDIQLASDVAKSAAINSLAGSGSFFDTHLAIGALSAYLGSFSPQDGEKLIEILQNNSQVRWILSDQDVLSFYKSIMEVPGIDADAKDYLETRIAEADELLEEEDAGVFG